MAGLSPTNAVIAIVAFEGPDEYARAGGLAVRVRDLSQALAHAGYETHLFFIGDPHLPGVETQGNLTLHRWGQWISAYHPGGVYDGEWGKMEDMAGSLPPYLAHQVVLPARAAGKVTVLMTEDWQTAATAINAASTLGNAGLEAAVIPVWTANNLYGFESIDLTALQQAATIMTVSKYMKHQMARYNLNPLVAPNGIAAASLVDVPPEDAQRVRAAFGSDLALFKIGRFSPDKRWVMAVDAVALLKENGVRARLLIRGDKLPYGQEILAHAYARGLLVDDLTTRYRSVDDLAADLPQHDEADILNLTAFLPDDLLPVIYAGVDAVLANSGFEPFGLVGLEVMGAGGLAVVGSTGEEYAESQHNALVLDTDDPGEIVVQLRRLLANPDDLARLKHAGKQTAREWIWPEVLRELFAKLEYVAFARGVEVAG